MADSEEPALRRRVELRKIINLRTNDAGRHAGSARQPRALQAHFSPERWQQFKHDVGYFRSQHDVKRWDEAQTDHGYNGTPVWNIVGTTLANAAPASDAQIYVLTRSTRSSSWGYAR